MAASLMPSAWAATEALHLERLFTVLAALPAPTHCTLSNETTPTASYAARQWVKAHAAEWRLDVWPTAHGEAMCIVNRKTCVAMVHIYGAKPGEETL